LEIDEMATAKKKIPSKRTAAAKKKPAAKKSPVKKPAAAGKKAVKGNFFRNALNDARGQMDEFVDSVKLKAKEMAAQEKLMQRKAELAAKAEMDKARHLARQAERWMRARIKSDTKKISRLEKRLARQLRDVERKLVAQARAAEKRANKQGRALKRKLATGTNTFGKVPGKAKVAAAKKKMTAPKKKVAAAKARARTKK
jgi:colicin import membrane protein